MGHLSYMIRASFCVCVCAFMHGHGVGNLVSSAMEVKVKTCVMQEVSISFSLFLHTFLLYLLDLPVLLLLDFSSSLSLPSFLPKAWSNWGKTG